MYDKIKLWIARTRATPDVLQYLDNGNEITDIKTGETCAFGSIGNLKVSVFVGGISIVGSLPKFLYHGTNALPIDRRATKEAIGKLSDTLHLSLDDAKVIGMEAGANFVMKHLPLEYIRRLGEMPRMRRLSVEDSTLYYKGRGKQQLKVFTFYDKKADAVAKDMECPKFDNMLRYEMRLNGRLPQQIGVHEVKASTLYDVTFYRRIMRMYQSSYFSISKSEYNQLKTDVMNDIKTVSDAADVFVARLIKLAGGDQISAFLDELKACKVFDDKKYYSRLKTKLEEISKKAGVDIPDELVRELDDEIKNFGAYV